MIPPHLSQFVLGGPPPTLPAACTLARDIASAALAGSPAASIVQRLRLEKVSAGGVGSTLHKAKVEIYDVLIDLGVPPSDLAEHWGSKVAPRRPGASVASSKPAANAGTPGSVKGPPPSATLRDDLIGEPHVIVATYEAQKSAELSAELRARCDERIVRSQRAFFALAPAAQEVYLKASLAEFEKRTAAIAEKKELSLTDRIKAEKAERFSQNWGAARDARRLELVAKYSALPAGPERVAFLQKHSNDLFAAARKIAGIKNHDQ